MTDTPAEAPRTPEEIARAIIGGNWPAKASRIEEAAVMLVRGALTALNEEWNAALHRAQLNCVEFDAHGVLWGVAHPNDPHNHACDACAPLRALLSEGKPGQ